MKRKTKIRLAIIVPLLVLFCVGTWHGINMLVARQFSLQSLASAGDVYWVAYVCRWDRKHVKGTPSPPAGTTTGQVFRVPKIGNVGGLDTPLQAASYHGHADVAQILLRAGGDVDALNYYRRNAMHLACRQGHHDVVILLMRAGADVNSADVFSRTPLDYAEDEEIRTILLKSDATPIEGRTQQALENTREGLSRLESQNKAADGDAASP